MAASFGHAMEEHAAIKEFFLQHPFSPGRGTVMGRTAARRQATGGRPAPGNKKARGEPPEPAAGICRARPARRRHRFCYGGMFEYISQISPDR